MAIAQYNVVVLISIFSSSVLSSSFFSVLYIDVISTATERFIG